MPSPHRALLIALACLSATSLTTSTLAWGHTDHRPRIGASHLTPSGAPESWGTYCVTELAPMFREAISHNRTVSLAAATDTTPDMSTADPLARPKPLLPPLPPSLMYAPAQPTDKIIVFVARKIVTMDPGWPEGTAVAVKDGRILSVGSLADLEPWLKRFPFTIDDRFKDKVIYPGFIEAHGHPVMGAIAVSRPPLSFYPLRNPYGPDFPGVRTPQQALATLKSYVAAAKSLVHKQGARHFRC